MEIIEYNLSSFAFLRPIKNKGLFTLLFLFIILIFTFPWFGLPKIVRLFSAP